MSPSGDHPLIRCVGLPAPSWPHSSSLRGIWTACLLVSNLLPSYKKEGLLKSLAWFTMCLSIHCTACVLLSRLLNISESRLPRMSPAE